MLTREEIKKVAIDYLIKNDFPIVPSTVNIVLPSEEKDDDPESEGFLEENNIAEVSCRSKYFDDPNDEHPCDPGVYIVYVDIKTGEVHMPRHM